MKFFKKSFCLSSFFIFSLVFAQNGESNKDTVIIDGTKYARIVDEQYFEDLDYDEGMWSIAPAYGFGVIKGSSFSSIPSGYSINVITPYGFDIGPLYYNISFAFGQFKSKYNQVSVDNIGITTGDSLIDVNPFYIGIGGDLNIFESFYSEGHIGRVGSGFGFRGFLGYNLGNIGDKLKNDLDINLKIGSEFYISSKIMKDSNPSYWATISLRGVYSFHTLFGS